MSKTILIKPNTKKEQYQSLEPISAIEPPLWLACMADTYEFGALIIDAEAEGLHSFEVMERVKEYNPEKIIILATGSHPSAHIQQKHAAMRLATVLQNSVPVEVYDYLPFNPIKTAPLYDRLPLDKYRAHNWHTWGRKNKNYGVVFTSISCPFECSFCCVKDFYRNKYQKRSPNAVINDFLYLYNEHQISNFKIMDEIFAMDNKHVKEICEQLKSIGDQLNIWAYARIDTITPELLIYLRKAGVKWLGFGIETGSEDIRKKILKGKFGNGKIKTVVKMTQDAGISVAANYMFGFREDDAITMMDTLNFAKELNTEYANFYCTVAYPGSKLYDEMKRKGVYVPKDSGEYAQLSYDFHPLSTKHLTSAEVLQFRDNAFGSYFTDPKYLRMMKGKFGIKAVKEIKTMTNIPISRGLSNEKQTIRSS